MTSIFISYRRNDDAVSTAYQLARELRKRFGEEQVFLDESSIPPGAEYPSFIRQKLEECSALLVVIGRLWLSESGKAGPNRLHDPEDWVRNEIRTTLGRDIAIIPVLAGGSMPQPDQFPEDLRAFADRQQFPLSNRHWETDTAALAQRLDGVIGVGGSRWKDLLSKLQRTFEAKFAGASDIGRTITVDNALDRYIPLSYRNRADEQRTQHPLTPEVLYEPKVRILLSGQGGAGKSMALLWLAIQTAQDAAVSSDVPIPLFGLLVGFDTKERTFEELIRVVANSSGLSDEEVDRLWRQDARPILFLLDGLNEVSQAHLRSCVDTIAREFLKEGHSFAVTSRNIPEAEELGAAGKFRFLEMLDLDDREVRGYLEKVGCSDVARFLTPDISSLLRRPFLLWAFATTACDAFGSGAAPRRGQLYRTLVDEFFFGRLEHAKRSGTRYSYPLVKRPILAAMANRMTASGVTREQNSLAFRRSVLAKLDELEADRRLYPESFLPERPNAQELIG